MKHVIFRSMPPKLLGSCIRRDTEFLKHFDKQNSKAGTCHSCLSFLLFYLSFLCHHLFHPCLCRLYPCQTHPCHPYWALSPWALGGSWGWERDKHDKTRMFFFKLKWQCPLKFTQCKPVTDLSFWRSANFRPAKHCKINLRWDLGGMTCSYTNDYTQQTSTRVQCFWHFPPGSHWPAARSKKGKLLRARIAFCADSGSMKFTKPMPFAHTIATTTAAFSMRKLKETAKNFWISFCSCVFFGPACALSGFLVLQCCSASTAKAYQWHTHM